MPWHDPWFLALVQIIALLVPAAFLAWLLRCAGVPGRAPAAAIVAGITIGLLAGPGVAGRAWPRIHERLFLGAVEESRELASLRSTQLNESAALLAAGVTDAAISEQALAHADQRRPLEESRRRALDAHRFRFDLLSHVVLALHLFLIAPTMVPSTERSLRRRAAALIGAGPGAIGAGALAFVLSCLPIALIGPALAGLSWPASIALALVTGAPAVVAAVRPAPYIAGAFAMALALAAALIIAWGPGLTITAGGLFLGLLASLGLDSRFTRRWRHLALAIAMRLSLPLLTALAAVRIDLHGSLAAAPWAFWTSVALGLIWASDGRWFCWMLAWRWLGPPQDRARAWSLAAMPVNAGAATLSIALALAFLGSGLFEVHILPGALLGAGVVELTTGARTWLAPYLDHRRSIT